MPCFRPLHCWRSPSGISFKPNGAYLDLPLKLPCGQCIGCRLERSRQWAVRCMHEASLHEQNSFISLTYAPEHLPPNGTLVKKDFQDFMKRLRKRLNSKVRYFHCGEYGEELARPHYHAILFGVDFSDKVKKGKSPSGHDLFTSEVLSDAWGKGFCDIGSVTFDSAAYVARYCTKKITGESATDHYAGRLPEYATMSRRPGIGKGWFEKFQSDTYPSDSVVMRHRLMKPPKYYDKQFELASPLEFAKVKRTRKAGATAAEDHPDNSSARLRVREVCQELNLKQRLLRSYEK